MFSPAYKITIGSKAVDTTHEPKASTLVDLVVDLDMETPADSFALTLGNVGGLKAIRDDTATIELGYADNGGLNQVITGDVESVNERITSTRVVGYTAARSLLRTFVNQTFESKTAGAIVRDLAGRASVDVDAVDDGISFPAYTVDGRRNIYRHMRDLADLCGFDLYINADGKLTFEKFIGGHTIHVFEFKKHIIAADALHADRAAGSIEAWGESPTGSQGDDAWGWLTKDFSGSKGAAGSGDPHLLLERPVLRTADAASAAADALNTLIDRETIRGRVLSVGRSEVKLGDAIALRAMPDDSLNASYQVRAVKHRITKLGGFTTLVEFRAIAP